LINLISISREERDYLKSEDKKIFCTVVGRSKRPNAKSYYTEDTSKVRKLLAKEPLNKKQFTPKIHT